MTMGYILDLFSSQIYDENLSNSSLFALCQFARNKEMSTYQIFTTLKGTEYAAAYKNIYKKIQMFQRQQLIQRTGTKDMKHASQYYQLTPIGIFCIFYHLLGKSLLIWGQMKDIISGLLNNYGDDDFFKIFVYPKIEKGTLLKLKSNSILEIFLNYCAEMSRKIPSKLVENAVNDTKNNYSSSTKKKNESLRKKKIKTNFFSSLKNKLDFEKENYLDVIQDKQGFLSYSESTKNFNEVMTSELRLDSVEILVKSMIFPIIMEGGWWSEDVEKYKQSNYKPYSVKHWLNIEGDIILLINDENFFKVLKQTKKGFDIYYNNISKLRKGTNS